MASAQALGRATSARVSTPAAQPPLTKKERDEALKQIFKQAQAADVAEGLPKPKLANFEFPSGSGNFFQVRDTPKGPEVLECEAPEKKKPAPKPQKPKPAPQKPPSSHKPKPAPKPRPAPRPEPAPRPAPNVSKHFINQSAVNLDELQMNTLLHYAHQSGMLKGVRKNFELLVSNPSVSERQLLISGHTKKEPSGLGKTLEPVLNPMRAAYRHDTERRDSVVVLSRPGHPEAGELLFSLPNHCTIQEAKAESRQRLLSAGLSAVSVYPGLGPALETIGGLGLLGAGLYQGVRNALNPDNKHEHAMELIRSGVRHTAVGFASAAIDLFTGGAGYAARMVALTLPSAAVDAAQYVSGSPTLRGLASKVVPSIEPVSADTSSRLRIIDLDDQKPSIAQRLIGTWDMVAAAPAAIAKGIGKLFGRFGKKH